MLEKRQSARQKRHYLFEKDVSWSLPDLERYPQSVFGAQRKHDVHTGVDIFVPDGTKVFPIKAGKVIRVEWFTGSQSTPPTPWWNDTQAVWVQSDYFNTVYLYGEIKANVQVGQWVTCTTELGTISQVLKKEKGMTPTSMLHFEMYSQAPEESAIWKLDEARPEFLLDPTEVLRGIVP